MNPYRVTSGIFVGDEVRKKGEYSSIPNKIFFEDGETNFFTNFTKKKKKFDNIIPVSSMFFGTNLVIPFILGAVAVMHMHESFGYNP